MMTFPNTVEEFMEQYKIVDTEKIYTNGADLVPIFRMLQWFEHVSATDTISRQQAIDVAKGPVVMQGIRSGKSVTAAAVEAVKGIIVEGLRDLPPAQPETATVTIGRTKGSVTMWYECDACGEPVDQNDNYCRNCGRKLKHE